MNGDVVKLQAAAEIEAPSYVALRYCWGGHDGVRLGAATVGRLVTGIPIAELPATIRDAIKLVRSLRIPYIWVDALCLDQDEEEWKSEASRMNEIYGGAAFTLSVVSAKHADEGFMNPRHGAALDPTKDAANFLGNSLFLRMPFLNTVRLRSPTSRRGWILQEEIFSPRLLYWSDHGVFWSCRSATIAENGAHLGGFALLPVEGAVPSLWSPLRPQDFNQSSSCIDMWDKIVDDISRREFGRPTDRLLALDGLANIVKASSEHDTGAYVAGTWEIDLPRELRWTPEEKGSADPCPPATWADPLAPSWSWASIRPGRRIEMQGLEVAKSLMSMRICKFSSDGLTLRAKLQPLSKEMHTFSRNKVSDNISYKYNMRLSSSGDWIHIPFRLDYQDEIWVEHLYWLEIGGSCRWLLLSDDVGLEAQGNVKVLKRVGISETTSQQVFRNVSSELVRLV